jgi:hypothetical protein
VRESINLLLYGFLAHTDRDRAKEWDALSPGGRATIYLIVQRALFDLFYCLNLLDSVILCWLDHPDAVVPKLGEVNCDDDDAAKPESCETDE